MSESIDLSQVLSGESGIVGRRARLRARNEEMLDGLADKSRLLPARLRRSARGAQQRAVLIVGIYDSQSASTMARSVRELERSKHHLTFALGSLDAADKRLAVETSLDSLRGRGKFENVNALLETRLEREADWVLIIDDDVELPRGFLDQFLFCAERFGFQLAQPALTRASHAAWSVMRRERWTVARRTRMVEIGPLTAFHSSVAGELLPFPPLQMGWGLDAHWGGLALERGWKLGVVDATAIRHERRPTAATYDRAAAEAEAEAFLADRSHIDREAALTVVERYRAW